MRMQDVWLARFKEVVQQEIDAAGGKHADGYRAVSTKTGLGYDYIYQIFTGKPANKPKLPGHDAMTAIERVYGAATPDTTLHKPYVQAPQTTPRPLRAAFTAQETAAPTLTQAMHVVVDTFAGTPDKTRQTVALLVASAIEDPAKLPDCLRALAVLAP